MFSNQTEIGKIFSIDSHQVGKELTRLGLKLNNQPTDLAKRANLCKKHKVWLWDKEEIINLFVALGYKKTGAAKKNEKKLKKLDNNRLIAFTDGSFSSSGMTYAVVLFDHDKKKHYIAGKETVGNNNKAELLAVKAVLNILPEGEKITIISDSLFVKRTLDKLEKAKKNLDIVDDLKVLCKKLDVSVVWVKSHTSAFGNTEVDALSTWARNLIDVSI